MGHGRTTGRLGEGERGQETTERRKNDGETGEHGAWNMVFEICVVVLNTETVDCGLWTVDWRLETGDWRLWTGDCGLETVDCGLWTVDCGLWTVDREIGDC